MNNFGNHDCNNIITNLGHHNEENIVAINTLKHVIIDDAKYINCLYSIANQLNSCAIKEIADKLSVDNCLCTQATEVLTKNLTHGISCGL